MVEQDTHLRTQHYLKLSVHLSAADTETTDPAAASAPGSCCAEKRKRRVVRNERHRSVLHHLDVRRVLRGLHGSRRVLQPHRAQRGPVQRDPGPLLPGHRPEPAGQQPGRGHPGQVRKPALAHQRPDPEPGRVGPALHGRPALLDLLPHVRLDSGRGRLQDRGLRLQRGLQQQRRAAHVHDGPEVPGRDEAPVPAGVGRRGPQPPGVSAHLDAERRGVLAVPLRRHRPGGEQLREQEQVLEAFGDLPAEPALPPDGAGLRRLLLSDHVSPPEDVAAQTQQQDGEAHLQPAGGLLPGLGSLQRGHIPDVPGDAPGVEGGGDPGKQVSVQTGSGLRLLLQQDPGVLALLPQPRLLRPGGREVQEPPEEGDPELERERGAGVPHEADPTDLHVRVQRRRLRSVAPRETSA